MKKIAYTLLTLVLTIKGAQAQSLGIGTTSPDPSARLDISSTTKGLLLPRMTAAQKNSIASPAPALMVYQTDGVPGLYYYNGSNWTNLTTSPTTTPPPYSATYGLTATVAGSGAAGNTDGTASTASFNYSYSITVDVDDNLYTADLFGQRIRRIANGSVATIAGGANFGNTQSDGVGGTFQAPQSLVVDAGGSVVYVADGAKLREIAYNGFVTTIATAPDQILALAMDPAGNIVASDASRIYRFGNGAFNLLAGRPHTGSSDGADTTAAFNDPTGLAFDQNGNIYVADNANNLIRKVSPTGIVTTLAGSGAAGSSDGPGSAASFNHPTGVAVDTYGNVYVTDQNNNKIRKVTPQGVVSTFAGSGAAGNGDGLGTAASFHFPVGITIDAAGYLYVSEVGNQLVRKITAF